MATLPFTLLLQGDIPGALGALLGNYIPYGMFWLFLGGIIFALVYGKTKSYGISGIIFILYSTLVGAVIPLEMQPYLLLLIGLMLAVMLIRTVIK